VEEITGIRNEVATRLYHQLEAVRVAAMASVLDSEQTIGRRKYMLSSLPIFSKALDPLEDWFRPPRIVFADIDAQTVGQDGTQPSKKGKNKHNNRTKKKKKEEVTGGSSQPVVINTAEQERESREYELTSEQLLDSTTSLDTLMVQAVTMRDNIRAALARFRRER
jgi:hypothetical protein